MTVKRSLLYLALVAVPVHAHEISTLPEIEAVADAAPGRTSLGTAAGQQPASVIVIDATQIEAMNISHVMDLFRAGTGLVVRNINQGDVGDDFGLRGFSGGHGVDAAVFVDGVPVNQVNGRTHGLADLNWLQPAMIDRVEIIKGPFSARFGNFALGGVVNIFTKASIAGARAEVVGGRYGYGRGTLSVGAGAPYLIGEVFSNDGYRDNAGSERVNLFARYGFELDSGRLDIAAQADTREFGAPGYLPVDDVRAGLLSRRSAVNSSDGGDVDHAQTYARYSGRLGADWSVSARAYAIKDERSRYADFGAGQSVTFTDNVTLGAAADVERVAGAWLFAAGVQVRHDDTEREAFRSVRRALGAATSNRRSEVLETSLFAEAQWAPRDDLKATAGVRWDRFDAEVENRFNPSASGDGVGDAVSPKVGLAWRPQPWIEVFANRGQGLRSPSQVELSPDTRNARFQDLEPFEVESVDLGARMSFANGVSMEIAGYRTETEGEFVQVAPGEFANLGSTERDGFEGELRWRGEWLEAFFGASRVDAELVTTSSARQVTGVPRNSQVAGITWKSERYVLDFYAQRYGRAPLDAASRFERPPVTALSGRVQRDFGDWSLFAQFTFNPDDDRSETQFVINGRNAFDPLPSFDAQIGVSMAL